MEAIKTVDLTKKYKDLVAVDRLNLSIEQGELFALLGVNGAGKTTAIKLLSCLTKPTTGDAFIFGKKTPLFLAMECIFNVSIFREQGIQRRFTNLYNISKNIFELYTTKEAENVIKHKFTEEELIKN